jgi:hypothetical protein
MHKSTTHQHFIVEKFQNNRWEEIARVEDRSAAETVLARWVDDNSNITNADEARIVHTITKTSLDTWIIKTLEF